MSHKRTRILKNIPTSNSGPVLYWMQRSQRVQDNWSLLAAIEYAKQHDKPVVIVFNLFNSFLEATIRQFDFMLKGIEQTANSAEKLNYPFYIFYGDPVKNLQTFIECNQISALFTDFNPLKLISQSKTDLVSKLQIPVFETDSSNIVPAWLASLKQEFGAYTLRPKIKKLLPEFLTEIPQTPKQKFPIPKLNFKNIKLVPPSDSLSFVKTDTTVKPVTWLKPGATEAHKVLQNFIAKKLNSYSVDRNNPNLDGVSHISPYLHYGQISAQQVAIQIKSAPYVNPESVEAYLEELIVRRELADNYCNYCSDYDNFNGFHPWAQKTLNEHRFDKREFIYSVPDFETAQTHDPLWNAAQNQLLKTGKMHGFMRMYWAKKILEWTSSPEEAQTIAIYLNDKYELDGIDPNGYTGIAWSIGGVHDRAWTERSVFGKIRFMNYNGCKRKFDVIAYQKQWND